MSQTNRLDVSALVDNGTVGAFHIVLFALCAMSLIMDGFDAQAMGFVGPEIQTAFGLSRDQFGNILGVLGTGALIFFLDPIQRAAERLSDAAMPNTVATPEYEAFRKLQVYDSAVRAALEDGYISARQRRVLDSMIASMGIDPSVAQRMEEDSLAALTGQRPSVEEI